MAFSEHWLATTSRPSFGFSAVLTVTSGSDDLDDDLGFSVLGLLELEDEELEDLRLLILRFLGLLVLGLGAASLAFLTA